MELASKRNLSLGWCYGTCWRLAHVGPASPILTAFPPHQRLDQRSILPWVTWSSGSPSSAPCLEGAAGTEGGLVPPVVIGARACVCVYLWWWWGAGVYFIFCGFPLVFWNARWLGTLAQAAGDDTMAWMHKAQRKSIFSQFWRLEVRGQGSSVLGFWLADCAFLLSPHGGLWRLFWSCKESIGRLLIPSDWGPTLGTHIPILPSKGPMFKYIALLWVRAST